MFWICCLATVAFSVSPDFLDTMKILQAYDEVISAVENHTESLDENYYPEISFDEADFTLKWAKTTDKTLFVKAFDLIMHFGSIILGSSEKPKNIVCKNCIVLKSQNATMLFNAKSKAITTGIYFKTITKHSCKINHFNMKFFDEDRIVIKTPNYTISSRKNVEFQFDHSITFDRFELMASSNDTSLLCVNEFKLIYKEPKQQAISS